VIEVSIGDKKYSVIRPKLQKWLYAENFRDKVIESADKRDDPGIVFGISSFLSALLDIPEEKVRLLPWHEVAEAYYYCSLETAPRLDLSIIHESKKIQKKSIPEVWDYEERTWYVWLHLLAKEYGWDVEYIAELDVDNALALIQEISLQDQFQREWEWSLSEVAYEYDKGSKKSKLRALPRPPWMSMGSRSYQKSLEQPAKQIKMKRIFMPVGIIIRDKDNTTDDVGGSNAV